MAQTVDLAGLFHDQGPVYDSDAEPSPSTSVTVRLRAAKGNLTAANVKYYDEADSAKHLVPMSKAGIDATGRYDIWQGTIPASGSHKYYYFQAIDGGATAWYNAYGASTTESSMNSFYLVPGFTTPDWMKNGVMYQIFPDRFFDGNPANNIRTDQYAFGGEKPLAKAWGDSPEGTDDSHGNSMVFFGGDLEGVRQKLGYVMKTLGANVVYLNPVFLSPTNHKYDTADYFEVDPSLGGGDALKKLIAAVHAGGGHILLDGVFNHTGDSNAWFGKTDFNGSAKSADGAYQTQAGPYSSWYHFSTWPNSYTHYDDAESMPKIDYGLSGSTVRQKIYAGPDSVVQTYLKPPWGIDGWRLDLAWMLDAGGGNGGDEVDHQIWREFRRAVKDVNPDAMILAEFWGDPNAWLYRGDQWDGTLNPAGFTDPVAEWITGKDHDGHPKSLTASQFDEALTHARCNLPTNVQEVMSNFLGNHDTTRFTTLADGDVSRTELGLILLMTYVGTPTIYYGDEYGMQGGHDPDNRRCFDWSQVSPLNPTIALTRKLIAIRKAYPALRTGSCMTLYVDDAQNVYAYARFDRKNRLAVVLNNGSTASTITVPVSEESVVDGSTLTDLIGGEKYVVRNGTVTLKVLPHFGAILAQ